MTGTDAVVKNGRAHVRRPSVKPRTRCGLRIPNTIPGQGWVSVDAASVPGVERCRKCFAGSGERG